MKNMELFHKLQQAEKYFTKDEYISIVGLSKELFARGQMDLCERELDKLPSRAGLLSDLVEKLAGKSVHKTLKKIQEGKVDNDLVTAKGLSSLLTHVIIEYEHGNKEFGLLLPNILEKLSEVIYNVL